MSVSSNLKPEPLEFFEFLACPTDSVVGSPLLLLHPVCKCDPQSCLAFQQTQLFKLGWLHSIHSRSWTCSSCLKHFTFSLCQHATCASQLCDGGCASTLTVVHKSLMQLRMFKKQCCLIRMQNCTMHSLQALATGFSFQHI